MLNNKSFAYIIALMTISLIGIIAVQVYWIRNSIELEEKQFERDVKSALLQVSENISERELIRFYDKNFSKLANTKGKLDESEIRDFIYEQIDTLNDERFIYSQTILEENYKVPTDFYQADSVELKKVYSKEEVTIIKNKSNREIGDVTSQESFIRYEQLEDYQKLNLKRQSKVMHNRLPLTRRISNPDLSFLIQQELFKRGVKLPFEFGVYDEGMATKLNSNNSNLYKKSNYNVFLFVGDDGVSDYELYVSFPTKRRYLFASVWDIISLSMLFISIIVLVYVSSLVLLVKQKKISEIKTDFINNMTHEFKTPIATINLALDAIKNPKILSETDKVLQYTQMIRDENKRMLTQVENVLQISKLEKDQLDIEKKDLDIHDVVNEALAHVDLMIKDRNGKLTLDLNADKTVFSGNAFHMNNVIVNILDNAIKYSKNVLEISIETVSNNKNVILKIKDSGIGMSKAVQKNIFEKFYREQTGNIHDVKGHGLGLSYVKRIIENHNGKITVMSEKGKGSTFTITLPIIKNL